VGAFGPNKPPLPGIEAYEGKGVFYLVKRREEFRGRRIVIAGGGDSAVDWAISLAEVAEVVYMVHRRPKFRAARRASPAWRRSPRAARSRWWCPISSPASRAMRRASPP
jgi:Thioredoxin reductase